jgi:hypothetical protein
MTESVATIVAVLAYVLLSHETDIARGFQLSHLGG